MHNNLLNYRKYLSKIRVKVIYKQVDKKREEAASRINFIKCEKRRYEGYFIY